MTDLSDVAATLLEESHGHWNSIEDNVTPGGTLGSPGYDLQKSSFAGAFGAEHSVELPAMNLKRDILKNDSSPDTANQLLEAGPGLHLDITRSRLDWLESAA